MAIKSIELTDDTFLLGEDINFGFSLKDLGLGRRLRILESMYSISPDKHMVLTVPKGYVYDHHIFNSLVKPLVKSTVPEKALIMFEFLYLNNGQGRYCDSVLGRFNRDLTRELSNAICIAAAKVEGLDLITATALSLALKETMVDAYHDDLYHSPYKRVTDLVVDKKEPYYFIRESVEPGIAKEDTDMVGDRSVAFSYSNLKEFILHIPEVTQ